MPTGSAVARVVHVIQTAQPVIRPVDVSRNGRIARILRAHDAEALEVVHEAAGAVASGGSSAPPPAGAGASTGAPAGGGEGQFCSWPGPAGGGKRGGQRPSAP